MIKFLLFALLMFSSPQVVKAESAKELHLIACSLLNKDGRVIYEFVGDYCIFLEDGSYISSILYENTPQIIRFSAYGEILWKRKLAVHHQMKLSNDKKKVFVLSQEWLPNKLCRTRFDKIEALDVDNGKSLFSWRTVEHVKELVDLKKKYGTEPLLFQLAAISKPGSPGCEFSHLNSIYEIPENETYKSIPAFKPGNFLVNYQGAGPVVILDDRMKKILWDSGLSSQKKQLDIHDPQVLSNGEIIFFRNSHLPDDIFTSSVETFNPVTEKTVVLFPTKKEDRFFSAIGGSVQVLGTELLIASNNVDEGGQVLRVDAKGNLLYKYLNPNREPPSDKPIFFQDVKVYDLSSFLKNNYKARVNRF